MIDFFFWPWSKPKTPAPRVYVGPPPPLPLVLKPGWDRMPKSEGAWQPPPSDPVPVSKDWVPPPRITPVITHRLDGDATVCGLHTLETTDKGKFTKQVDQPGLTLFHCNIVGDEERVSHCATCFSEYSNPNEAPTGYLAKSYITYGDVMGSPPALAAPTTDEKGRVPPESTLPRGSFGQTISGIEALAEDWLLSEDQAVVEEDPEATAEMDRNGHAKPSMSAEQFVCWLQGVFEVQNPESLNADQIKIIKEHLALVLTHVSGPSYRVRGRLC